MPWAVTNWPMPKDPAGPRRRPSTARASTTGRSRRRGRHADIAPARLVALARLRSERDKRIEPVSPGIALRREPGETLQGKSGSPLGVPRLSDVSLKLVMGQGSRCNKSYCTIQRYGGLCRGWRGVIVPNLQTCGSLRLALAASAGAWSSSTMIPISSVPPTLSLGHSTPPQFGAHPGEAGSGHVFL